MGFPPHAHRAAQSARGLLRDRIRVLFRADETVGARAKCYLFARMFGSARFVTWAPALTVLTAALVWACSNDASDVVDVTEPTMAEVHVSPALVPTESCRFLP